jgi:hypothetical protein
MFIRVDNSERRHWDRGAWPLLVDRLIFYPSPEAAAT